MKTFAMMILGCKVNDYEATYIKTKLLEKYIEVPFKEKADIYIVFTCCVTNVAEAKTRKMLHHCKKTNPKAYVVAVGCLAQIKGHTADFADVDLIIGSKHKDEIITLIEANTQANKVEALTDVSFEELYLDSYPGKSRAFLKIQDGCNQFCSYCVIPYARGRERSAKHLTIIEQAKKLSQSSKELVLTGIHTGRYNDGEFNLYQLLVELNKIDSLATIRLSSIEMTEISDEIIDLMKNSNKIAHHLHIPIQSASDTILKLMNRPYRFEEFFQRTNYIRQQIPDISISTDLIVGFPGEDEALFKETLANLKLIHFSFIHVFPYAKKAGTKAEKLNGHLANDVKKQRVNQVIEQQKALTLAFNKTFINKTLSLLIEKGDDNIVYGYVKQYIYVKAAGKGNVGDVVKVVIDKVNENEVLGHVIK